jgi:transcription initiation factor TFIIIB Brf1 subunit/transcription initiation factor TFIIB
MSAEGIELGADKVPEICEDLRLARETQRLAVEIADVADWAPENNHSPRVTAAGAVYVAGALQNEDRTQEAISEVTGVSVASIARAYQNHMERGYAEEAYHGRDW